MSACHAAGVIDYARVLAQVPPGRRRAAAREAGVDPDELEAQLRAALVPPPTPGGEARGAILLALRDRGEATSTELAADVGCSRQTALVHLRALAAEGRVERTGHARASRWRAL